MRIQCLRILNCGWCDARHPLNGNARTRAPITGGPRRRPINSDKSRKRYCVLASFDRLIDAGEQRRRNRRPKPRLGSPASHGCVRLAPGNAAKLFELVRARGLPIPRSWLLGIGRRGGLSRDRLALPTKLPRFRILLMPGPAPRSRWENRLGDIRTEMLGVSSMALRLGAKLCRHGAVLIRGGHATRSLQRTSLG